MFTYKGIDGQRLKTIKLKGQVSQGLLMPLSEIPKSSLGYEFGVTEGEDLTEFLGILKWERDIPAQLAGQIKGNFPHFIWKTDQERIQNCTREFPEFQKNLWEITEKLDGSSMTVYYYNGDVGVCSRNLDLKVDEANAFWECALRLNLPTFLIEKGQNIALQGELIGPGIQGNPYGLHTTQFFIFDIFDINHQSYLLPRERQFYCQSNSLRHVPVIDMAVPLADKEIPMLLAEAEGMSQLANVEREGLVFKQIDHHQHSFKVISNEWLLKNE